MLPIISLVLPFIANYIRQVRSAMLDCIRQDYVRTARSKGAKERRVIFHEALKNALLPIITMSGSVFANLLGGSPGYIMLRHMCPNLASVIIINGTTRVSINIMQGATLGFIGLGAKAPTPEWGTMLSEGLTFFMHQHMVLIPGIMLCIAALCINTFGDCLRDAFDPQLKGKA